MSHVAPDGSPLALYLALPGDMEATVVHDAVPAGAAILELGTGPGRVTRRLLDLGHPVTAIDNDAEMLAHVPADAETVLADMRDLDLSPRRWPVVLLASHAVNDPLGPTFLAVAARHIGPDGVVVVQRHEPGWIEALRPVEKERDGVRFAVTDVGHPASGTATATMVYVVEDEEYRQPFTAHEVDLDAMGAACGLRVDAVLDEAGTWVRMVLA